MNKDERIKDKGEGRGLIRVLSSHLALSLLFILYLLSFSLSVSAQDDPLEVAPPPLKIFSKDERARLDGKPDLKDRTRLALDLMDLRLDAAEKFAAGHEFESMFRELGGFHALMDESLEFLDRRDTGRNGRVLDNFKRIEIGLRMFSPRIETIRRELPLRYDDYVRKLMKYVRDARTRATEPLFGNTVVPNRKPGE